MSGRARKPIVALLVAVGTLALAEGAARLALGDAFRADVVTDLPMNACVTHDPELGWRNRPDLRAETVGPTRQFPVFRYRVTINSRGLRDAEYEATPAPGVTRIVVLGDSFAWGWGVDDGESFADVLDRSLGPAVEVVNLGVPGYSTDQELLWFEREGQRYEPDLVVLCLLMNDIQGNHDDLRDGLGKPRLVPDGEGGFAFENLPVTNGPGADAFREGPFDRLRKRSALLRLLEPREVVRPGEIDSQLSELSPEELRDRMLELEWPFLDEAEIGPLAAELIDPASPTHELLRRLQRSAEAVGAPLLAFSVAHYHDYYLTVPGKPEPPAVQEALDAGVPFRTRLTARLQEAGAAIGFDTLSVDQAMLDAVRAGTVLNVGDGHLNEEGNALVAEELASWIRPRLDELAE